MPAGLRRQWRAELAAHFDIDATAADALWLRRTYAELPADVSPWSLPGVYITSIDFLKRADVLRAIEWTSWDALVVDEAHAAAAPTDRYAALSQIAARSRTVVTITATPFSGDTAAYASLIRLGTTTGEPPLMFRRSREDAGVAQSRRHRFAGVRITAAERRLQRLLERYTREVWTASRDEGARLAMTVLRKRALSSPHALARSLHRRAALLGTRPDVPRQLTLFDDDLTREDEEPIAALAAPGLDDSRREHRWLARLAAAAQEAPDSKQQYLVRLLRRLRNEPAIVFTEYRDTLRRLADRFPGCLLLHGGMTTAERSDVQQRFNADGGLLLATDAASEGLNLQRRCRTVVCYELPWNPARLEQRIGRVDRIGQPRRVHAITLVARDTAEDLVVANLARRLARIAAALGDRDRLAAYLTEARTAGIVIGGAPEDPPEAPLPPITPEPPCRAALEEAERISTITAGAGAWCDGDVLVSTARATTALPRGVVLVYRWTALAGDGRAIDRDVWIVRSEADVARRPRRAADARRVAADAIARFGRAALELITPAADARLSRVRSLQRAIVDRAIAREVELRDWGTRADEVQPGLFDRRALTQASEQASARERARAEHDRRIVALAREHIVEPRIDLAAVLIVHGTRAV